MINNIPEEDFNFSLDIDDISSMVSANVTSETPNEEEVVDSISIDPENIIPETTGANATAEQGYNNDAYTSALTLLKESGMFEIPDTLESVDDEIWSDIVNYNKDKYKNQIIEEIRLNAADPKIAELFDYVQKGGSWFGAEDMINTINDESSIEQLDPSDSGDQRYLIETYLAEGLDPNNPVHARRLQTISSEVDDYIDRLESEDLAKEAKEFYLGRVSEQKQYLIQQQEEQAQREALAAQDAQQKQQDWIHSFKSSLNEQKWSEDKKKQVIDQFSHVELDNGQTMEMWRYKFDAIWQDPKNTQIFLDFLSDFDPYKLQFNRNGVPSNKVVSSTIQDIINSKIQQKSKSQHSDQRVANNSVKTIDPRNM
jgi:hypothetical protein